MSRILVVDDEPLIAMMAEDWLRELGHSIVGPAHDLASGLELSHAQIDGAVIDVTLGKDSGFGIAQALIVRNIPFIFATGHSLSTKDLPYRPIAILIKPFEFESFERAVRTMLGTLPQTKN